MAILSSLYQMIIGPLEILFEVIYQLSYEMIGNAGFAIIPVSLAISFLCLPLYLRADAIQKENKKKEDSMAPYVDHIKKHFTGAERYMMLQTYYRLENYKPIHTLRNSFSLLLQIPFFIAAYHFLSNLELIQGVPFGPISDLGRPDGLLVIGGLSVNLLPILMTVVNIASSAIYSKKNSIQDNIQLYGLAIVFLVLLYQSPSGLVFYWLLNNVFSLLKNVFLSFKKPKKYLFISLSISGCLILIPSIVLSIFSGKLKTELIVIGLLLQLPIIFNIISKNKLLNFSKTIPIPQNNNIVYFV
ncbi:membrane protein insertase YidC, partial [bacterium]|nr:membrane protein insertase YidC [bacterium]